jgi:hypothetical protein
MAANPPPNPTHQPTTIPPSLTTMHTSNITRIMHLLPQVITDNTNTVIHPTPIAIHILPIHLSILHLL